MLVVAGFILGGLERVIIEDGVTSIGDSAFRGCYILSCISLPDSVTSIGDNTFRDCVYLREIVLPDSITRVGEHTFNGCRSLQYVKLGSGVQSIGSYAFNDCYNLIDITISKSVTSIGSYAFNGCRSLPTLVLHSGITSVGSHAFYDCGNLTVFAENQSRPADWSDSWNATILGIENEVIPKRPVLWGCSLSEDKSAVVSLIMTESTKVQPEGTSILPPYRHGYAFCGWATDTDGPRQYSMSSIGQAPEGTVLYAVWQKLETRTYTLIVKEGDDEPLSVEIAGYIYILHPQLATLPRAGSLKAGMTTRILSASR